MIEPLPRSKGDVLGFKLSGKLHDEDYKVFVPAIDAVLASQPKVRLLALMHDFQGWDMHALWDDIKFAATHMTKVERIALVGDKSWEKWMAAICKPFTMATVKYFDADKLDEAWQWVESPA